MVKSTADLVHAILDPVLAKRTGLSLALIDTWPQIVGARLAGLCHPLKVDWPRRHQPDDPFEPGILVVAAEGTGALHVQHQTGQIIDGVNAFMGYRAVARVKIVQKQIAPAAAEPRRTRSLTDAEEDRIDRLASGFEDEKLRESVRRYGRSVLAERGS